MARPAVLLPLFLVAISGGSVATVAAQTQQQWSCAGSNAGWMQANAGACVSTTTFAPPYCDCDAGVLYAQTRVTGGSGCQKYAGCLMSSPVLDAGRVWMVAQFPQLLYPQAVGYFAAFGDQGMQAQFVFLGGNTFRFQTRQPGGVATWNCKYPADVAPGSYHYYGIEWSQSGVSWYIVDASDNAYVGWAPLNVRDTGASLQFDMRGVTTSPPANGFWAYQVLSAGYDPPGSSFPWNKQNIDCVAAPSS